MPFLLRVELPDVPGSLGRIASAIGQAGGDIEAIEIVEKRDGTAVDDVLLETAPGAMPDSIVSACTHLEGVKVLWISRYAAGGGLVLDLEAVEDLTEHRGQALTRLIEVLPVTFRADWAAHVRRTDGEGTRPEDDDNWVQVAAMETTGHTFEPLVFPGEGASLTFQLTGTAQERTGWGWAVGGVDGNQTDSGLYNFISVTEVSATGTVANMVSEPGDFNGNGVLDAPDIDDLTGQSASGANLPAYDLNSDDLVNEGDIQVWVKDLFGSWIGDADLNGEFSSGDLVTVLASGTYETALASVWTTGDFNGDGVTNSNDLVTALADGGYEMGPRTAVSAVPEPTSFILVLLGALASARCLRRRI